MKATIEWIVLDWTPWEIAEYQLLLEKNKVQTMPTIILKNTEELDKLKEITHVRPCWPRAILPSHKKPQGSRNPYGPGWQKIWTISVLNWNRVEYKNQSTCARVLNVDQTLISKRKDTGRAVNGYYISTKHP